jgi:hypothetical protein
LEEKVKNKRRANKGRGGRIKPPTGDEEKSI